MISPTQIIVRLLLAAILGAVIGINRERRDWAAGLRTHMLVSLGAALAIIVSAFGFADVLGRPAVVLDPSRIAAQVVSGIGFLGAGTILFMQREQVIRGLTTAAALWAVAMIGLAVGSGMYFAAVAATAVAWVILALLKPLQRKYLAHPHVQRIRVIVAESAPLSAIEAALARHDIAVRKMILRRQEERDDELDLLFSRNIERAELVSISESIGRLPGVRSVSILLPQS